MYKPPYWFYKNIKFPDEEIDDVIEGLKGDEPLLSSYFLESDKRPDKIWANRYHTIMEGLTKSIGMFSSTQYIFEYWSQLYYKTGEHSAHHHCNPDELSLGAISWVHFHRTPNKNNFMFIDGNGQDYIPKEQNEGDIICFPNYLWHQVFPNKSNSRRFVCAGNLRFIHIDTP